MSRQAALAQAQQYLDDAPLAFCCEENAKVVDLRYVDRYAITLVLDDGQERIIKGRWSHQLVALDAAP